MPTSGMQREERLLARLAAVNRLRSRAEARRTRSGWERTETGDARGPALEVSGVSASYGPYRALFDVSFTIRQGEAVALIGPNGAGKSTVARAVTGLIPVTDGSVRVGGQEITGLPTWQIARAGVVHVPEGRAIFAGLSVEENLRIALRRRSGRSRTDEALLEAYSTFPMLAERRHQSAGTLSGGQQRLLSLAPALMVPSTVLITDELSLGLAPAWLDVVYERLAEVHRRGTAVLIIEQQIDRALAIADSAVVLQRGSVCYVGTPSGAASVAEELITTPGAGWAAPGPGT